MNEKPLVSVVIPTRNRRDVLWRRCLIGNVFFALRPVSA